MKFPGLLLAAFVFFLNSCHFQNVANKKSNETVPNKTDALGWPIDAVLNEDGSFLILYTSNSEISDAGSSLVWFDDTGIPFRQMESHLDFPHTLDVFGGAVLISDSMNQRLLIVSDKGDQTEEINFTNWEYDAVWPNDADFTSDGNIVFSDLINMTINKITPDGELIWRRMPVNESGEFLKPSDDELHDPDEIAGGRLIYCLSRSGQVVEIDENDEVTWSYGNDLLSPKSVQRLDSGSTMITDLTHIVEVSPDGEIVWEYDLPYRGGMNSHRLENGNTLIGTHVVSLIAPDGSEIWRLTPAFQMTSSPSGKSDPRLKLLKSIGYLN